MIKINHSELEKIAQHCISNNADCAVKVQKTKNGDINYLCNLESSEYEPFCPYNKEDVMQVKGKEKVYYMCSLKNKLN